VAMRRPRSWIFCSKRIVADDFPLRHVDQPHMAILTQHERGSARRRELDAVRGRRELQRRTHGQGKISRRERRQNPRRGDTAVLLAPGGAHEIGRPSPTLPSSSKREPVARSTRAACSTARRWARMPNTAPTPSASTARTSPAMAKRDGASGGRRPRGRVALFRGPLRGPGAAGGASRALRTTSARRRV